MANIYVPYIQLQKLELHNLYSQSKGTSSKHNEFLVDTAEYSPQVYLLGV